MPLGISLVPPILRPDYAWPAPVPTSISQTTPPVPRIPSKASRRFWGFIHNDAGLFLQVVLRLVWCPFQCTHRAATLWSCLEMDGPDEPRRSRRDAKGSRCRDPVSKVPSCGEHPGDCRKISILMTRLPGIDQAEQFERSIGRRSRGEPWLHELQACIKGDAHLVAAQPGRDLLADWHGVAQRASAGSCYGPVQGRLRVLRSSFLSIQCLIMRSSPGKSSKRHLRKPIKKKMKKSHQIKFTHGDLKAHKCPCGRRRASGNLSTEVWRLVSGVLGVHDSNAVWNRERVVSSGVVDGR